MVGWAGRMWRSGGGIHFSAWVMVRGLCGVLCGDSGVGIGGRGRG